MATPADQPDENVVPLVPPGKIRCFITGKLRKETPEEHIRQRWARSLVEEYKYRREDIGVEASIKMGRARKKADLVVYHEGTEHKQENVFIVVEAKRAGVRPKDQDEGEHQLKSYMSACSRCRYGLWAGSERKVFERLKDGSINPDVADIPSRGDLKPRVPKFSDLVPALDLKAVFRRCHNYIYANEGLQKAEAFHEMLKLIFCKVYDETESTGDLRFYILNEERQSEAGKRRVLEERITPLFENVKQRYNYIFKQHENVDLNLRALAYVVSELQRLSLLQTRTDVKGSAYEELVGENLRGDRGEYFTPRNVCDMAVGIVCSTYPVEILTSLRILDTCCGTGGFLVSFLNYLRSVLAEHERKKRGETTGVEPIVNQRIRGICSRNLYGVDINPFLVRTCQMNLVMHGDGSANVYQADTLTKQGEWADADAAKNVPHGDFDVVLTNPPFGAKAIVDDPHILSSYELASFDSKKQRASMPAEQLFVEAALNFVKPGGRLAIVLPDSILNNPGLEFIRRWLVKRTRLVASVDLPKETFATSGGVPNPSVLVVEKLAQTDRRLAEAGALDPYEVFMAIPQTAGRDKRGNPVYKLTPEGYEVLDEDTGEPILDDEIALVADRFAEWVANGGYARG